jgi:hypothetical protein
MIIYVHFGGSKPITGGTGHNGWDPSTVLEYVQSSGDCQDLFPLKVATKWHPLPFNMCHSQALITMGRNTGLHSTPKSWNFLLTNISQTKAECIISWKYEHVYGTWCAMLNITSSIHPSVHPSIHPSIRLSINQTSIHPSNLSIYTSIYLSITIFHLSRQSNWF